ncbi:uncharacterized protein [Hetaerina americana]|uniref:uncharacterized protein n=1 Tax=Hetaerina americana TaxID=62018 RepID=UPI003A7F501D
MSLSWKETLFQFAITELSSANCSVIVDYLKDEAESCKNKVIAAALGASVIPSRSDLEGSFMKISRKESSLGRYFSICSESLELLVQDVGVAMKGEKCPYISLHEGILFVAWMLCQLEDSEPPLKLVEPSVTLGYFGKIIKALASVSSERVSWPSHSQIYEVVDAFDKMYGFPGVVGVLVTSKLPILMKNNIKSDISVSYSMEDFYDHAYECPTVALQAVVDHREEIRDVCVGLPGSWSPNKVLRSSRLYSRLVGSDVQDKSFLITEGYHLLAGCEYFHLPTLITPYDLRVTGSSQVQFSQTHEEAVNFGSTALSNFISKFPRLKSLNLVNDWNPLRKEFHLGGDMCHSVATVTLAACVLHNSSLE